MVHHVGAMESWTSPCDAVSLRPRRGAAAAIAFALAAAAVALGVSPDPAAAGSLPVATRLVSRANTGAPVTAPAFGAAMSDNGRFVAFETTAAVVAADTNGKSDIYIRDLWAGTTELVSVTNDEKPLTGASRNVTVSDDGRFVAFLSDASNLIPGDDKGHFDVFVRDRFEQTTRWMNPSFAGTALLADTIEARISGDGSAIAFVTDAATVVGNDTNGVADVFVRDVFGTSIERVSVFPDGSQATERSTKPALSDDGRYVVFSSDANLAGGVIAAEDLYRRDRTTDTTVLVDIRNGGGLPDLGAGGGAVSGNGRWVAFASEATNIVTGDTNGAFDVFLRDMTTTTVTRVSLSDSDAQLPAGGVVVRDGISDDVKTILFASLSPATAAADAGNDFDLYARSTATGTTRRLSTGPSAADPVGQVVTGSLDGSGTTAAFDHAAKLTGESPDQVYTSGPVDIGPFVNVGSTISAQYHDFLGRSPTAAETSTWTNRFSTGQAQYPALIAALAADPAFSAKRAPLIRLYWAFFLRRPDAGGLTYWLGTYQGGASLTSIAETFAASSEFTNRYGSVSNQQYVKLVYQNIFRRQPDAGGLAYWTERLNTGAITRGAVIVQFSESAEGKRRLAGPTNLTLVSLGMLRTTPSAAQWTAIFEPIGYGEPQSAAFAAHEFANTAQYQARYQ